MSEKLKPCKECGSNNIDIESIVAGFDIVYRVKCYKCGATGKHFFRIEKAVNDWNRRADDGKN